MRLRALSWFIRAHRQLLRGIMQPSQDEIVSVPGLAGPGVQCFFGLIFCTSKSMRACECVCAGEGGLLIMVALGGYFLWSCSCFFSFLSCFSFLLYFFTP